MAGAAVLAAATTAVLAVLAFVQLRASKRQSDALNRQADAMSALAHTAAAQEFRNSITSPADIFSTPEQSTARALQDIATTLRRAYPPNPAGDGERRRPPGEPPAAAGS